MRMVPLKSNSRITRPSFWFDGILPERIHLDGATCGWVKGAPCRGLRIGLKEFDDTGRTQKTHESPRSPHSLSGQGYRARDAWHIPADLFYSPRPDWVTTFGDETRTS